jgi:hypothetical protein
MKVGDDNIRAQDVGLIVSHLREHYEGWVWSIGISDEGIEVMIAPDETTPSAVARIFARHKDGQDEFRHLFQHRAVNHTTLGMFGLNVQNALESFLDNTNLVYSDIIPLEPNGPDGDFLYAKIIDEHQIPMTVERALANIQIIQETTEGLEIERLYFGQCYRSCDASIYWKHPEFGEGGFDCDIRSLSVSGPLKEVTTLLTLASRCPEVFETNSYSHKK